APSAFAGPGGRMSTPRVMVGVSGGVDSSVAAWRAPAQPAGLAGGG
ncbi:tRNA 2-thiouridine(34) synthase MnmA, partial [Stenotrophomonas maltophilia]